MSTSESVEILNPPVKLEKDKKEYRTIKLVNGLKALLISHAALHGPEKNETDRKSRKMSSELLAGIALSVDVGSFHDITVSVPGMAHFCEHMMFLGSEKYPEENALDEYLNEYGGSSNAVTLCEDTIYNIWVTEAGLTGALDRLTALMKAPLLSFESMTREREAVDTEFQERKHDVEQHIEQFLIEMGSSSHPANNFNWGNLETLKEDISDEDLHEKLHEFRNKYYLANRMNLCIQSRLSLDELQNLVIQYFSDIPHDFSANVDLSAIANYSHTNAFKTKFFNKMGCVNTAVEENRLFLTWVLPPLLHKYRSKPLEFVRSILLAEDPGSLISYLTDNSLAQSMDIELDYADFEYNSLFTLFKLDIQLTEYGMENLNEVLDAVFSYFLFLKEQPIDEDYYNYLGEIAKSEFIELPEQSPYENVVAVASNMKYYDSTDYIFGLNFYLEFNENDIREVIDALNQPKFNIFLVSEGCEVEKQAKYFEFGYSEEVLPKYCMKAWKDRQIKEEFLLPVVGELEKKTYKIFYNSKIKVPPYPKKIFDGVICEAFHRLDDRFETPMCAVNINLVSPLPLKSLENYILQRLHYHAFDLVTDQIEFPDSVQNAHYKLTTHLRGMMIEVTGYYKPVQTLVKLLIKSLKDLPNLLDEETFDGALEALKAGCVGTISDASNLSTEFLDNIIEVRHQMDADVLTDIDNVTYESFKDFTIKWSKRLFIQVLAQGNITKTITSTIVKDIITNINCRGIRDKSVLSMTTRKIPLGKRHVHIEAPTPQNSAITNYYQIGEKSIHTQCLLDLFISIIKEPMYFVLRTREQLAYTVSEAITDHNNIIGFTITVSSKEDKNPAIYVDEKTSDFIRREVKEILENMTVERFNTFRDTQIRLKKLMDLELSNEIDRNFDEIILEEYLFDRREREIDYLEKVTKTDLITFYENYLTPENTRNISIHIIGPNEAKPDTDSDDNDDEDDDVENDDDVIYTMKKLSEFKNSLELYRKFKTIL